MARRTLLFFLTVISFIGLDAQSEVKPIDVISKSKALEFFSVMQKDNSAKIQDLDIKIKSQFRDVTQTQDARLLRIESQVEGLIEERNEFLLRQQFLERIIINIDRNYAGNDFDDYITNALVSMAQVESTNNLPSSLWKFMSHLSYSIKQIKEKHEDTLAFVASYIKFSTISKPKRPEELIKSRDYTNGIVVESAHSKSPTLVGEIVEKQFAPDNEKVLAPIQKN